METSKFTPHARGSTVLLNNGMSRQEVYPACAGIDRSSRTERPLSACLPRMRGDRPQSTVVSTSAATFTPHARGSTVSWGDVGAKVAVYPACAGIDLEIGFEIKIDPSLPRMRGDRPLSVCFPPTLTPFTPHARGSTFLRKRLTFPLDVYPACAGIDLKPDDIPEEYRGLPRMRGDRPRSFLLRLE